MQKLYLGGDTDQQRPFHTVSWSFICKPKALGVLVLRSMRTLNSACFMKAGWKLCSNKDGLWASIIRSKYRCRPYIIPKIQSSRAGSNFWHGICYSWDQVQQNITCRLGDGKKKLSSGMITGFRVMIVYVIWYWFPCLLVNPLSPCLTILIPGKVGILSSLPFSFLLLSLIVSVVWMGP